MTIVVRAVTFVLGYALGHALGRLSRGLVRLCQRIWTAGEDVSWQAS
jgi:hypothetical protein